MLIQKINTYLLTSLYANTQTITLSNHRTYFLYHTFSPINVLSGEQIKYNKFTTTGVASSDEYRLLQDLFERREGGYNPRIRPVENISDVIETGFEMALIQLINLVSRMKRG